MYEQIEKHYIENYKNYLYIYQRSIGKINAEDCIQEAYTDILEFINEGGTVRNISNLMNTVLRNKVVQHVRKERQRGMVFTSNPYDPNKDLDEHLTDIIGFDQDIDTTMKYIKTKRGKHKDVLILSFVHQVSYRRISKIVKVSYMNVRKIIQRLRNDLRNEQSNLLSKDT